MAAGQPSSRPGDGIAQLKTLIQHLHTLPVVRFPSQSPSDRRASVSAVLRVRPTSPVPASLPPAKDATTFLEQDWVQRGVVELLFVQRALNPQDTWSGDVAFPGGKRDPQDSSDLDVAIRETAEEIGLDLNGTFEYLGELDEREVKSFSGEKWLTLCCFVFLQLTPVTLEMKLQTTEIAAAFWVPLSLLHDMAASENTTKHERWRWRSYSLSALVLPGGSRGKRRRNDQRPLMARIFSNVVQWSLSMLLVGVGDVSFGGICLPVEDNDYVQFADPESKESPSLKEAEDEAVVVDSSKSVPASRDISDEEDNVLIARSSTTTPPSELAESQWIDLTTSQSGAQAAGKPTLLQRHPPHSVPILWGLTLFLASDIADLLFLPSELPPEPLSSKSRSKFSAKDVATILDFLHPHQIMIKRKPMIGFDNRDESGAGEAVSLEEDGIGEFKDQFHNRLSFGNAVRISVACAIVLRSAGLFWAFRHLKRIARAFWV